MRHHKIRARVRRRRNSSAANCFPIVTVIPTSITSAGEERGADRDTRNAMNGINAPTCRVVKADPSRGLHSAGRNRRLFRSPERAGQAFQPFQLRPFAIGGVGQDDPVRSPITRVLSTSSLRFLMAMAGCLIFREMQTARQSRKLSPHKAGPRNELTSARRSVLSPLGRPQFEALRVLRKSQPGCALSVDRETFRTDC